METPVENPAEEIKRLRRCINDLVSVLALPAIWTGGEPSRVISTLLDAVLGMLRLDFVYLRLNDRFGEAPFEMLRSAPSQYLPERPREIEEVVSHWLRDDPNKWPPDARIRIGDGDISIVPLQMGLHAEIGVIVAGSQRPDFPSQTERLVLSVAANQAAIGLREAQTLSGQKRAAHELDRRVTQRTKELAQSNEELQVQLGLLQRIPVAAWTVAPDGTSDFVNQTWLEYTGQTVDYLRSSPEAWMAAVHPEDRETTAKSFWDGVRSGQGFAMESRFLRARDRTYRWHLNRCVVLRDAEGKILKFVGTSTDIEDLKRSQEALRASEAQLRQTVDSIPGLICTMSLAGEITTLNKQLLEYFGKTAEELKGWRMTDAVHPDDLPRVIAAFDFSVRTGTPYHVEHRCRRADGVYRWFQVRALPVQDKDGQNAGWYVLLTDIEDRKRTEEELRRSEAFLTQGQRLNLTGTFSWYLDTDEITFSEQLFRIFELDPAAPVTLEQIGSRVHPDDIPLLTEKVELTRKGISDHDYGIRLRMPDGKVKYLRTKSYGIRGPDGRLEHIGAIQDVTEQRLAEEALNKLQSELAHMARFTSLGALTASVAHEVNQPLSGIVTNAGTCLRMLAAEPPNIDGARETARRTIRDGERATDVIKRLRKLFTKTEITIESVDLNEATRVVIALAQRDLERNQVILRQELAENLPRVTGDCIQLQQVILNLLSNASDAMSGVEDRPRLLTVRTELDAENYVRLSVEDRGIGIEPPDPNRLFDGFYTTKSTGMGIGLSVSRSIIESHQGRLWAERNDGPGATFSFSLPSSPNSRNPGLAETSVAADAG
jgi:PAS domain S-box-containing protein